jgi:hypothetical protein
VITLVLLAACQDLFQRSNEGPVQSRVGPDRLDLRVGPAVDRSSGLAPGRIGLDINFIPDLACGQFDLTASFQSVMGKNMREELLGDVVKVAQKQLVNSAMVLACQMSPTVCDAMKHYRVTAQEYMNMQLDQCRSIEQIGGGGGNQKLRAEALKQCLEQKQALGLTLDEAMRLCQGATEVRGLRGQKTEHIDLVKEVAEALGLKGEPRELLSKYLNGLTLGAQKLGGDVRVRATDERYEKHRADTVRALSDALAAAEKGPVPQKRLDAIAPAGTPPMTNDELQRMLALDPVDRAIVVSMLASASSLARVAREAGDVQAALATARSMNASPAVLEALDKESRRLEDEVRRLRESFEMEQIVAQARLRADAAATSRLMERARQNTAAWRERDRQNAAAAATQEWSKACPTQKK